MMFLLILNITYNLFDSRFADTETGKTVLPLEMIKRLETFFDPPGRICFNFVDEIRNSHGRFNFAYQMSMIADRVDFQQCTTRVPNNPW